MTSYGGRSAMSPGKGGGRSGMGKGGDGAATKTARQVNKGMGMTAGMAKGNRKTAKSAMANSAGGCKTSFVGHGAFRC
jgi:hypothetical protein